MSFVIGPPGGSGVVGGVMGVRGSESVTCRLVVRRVGEGWKKEGRIAQEGSYMRLMLNHLGNIAKTNLNQL